VTVQDKLLAMAIVAFLDLREIAAKAKWRSTWVSAEVPLGAFKQWDGEDPEKIELSRKAYYFQLNRLRERYPVPKGELA
jgi:hypothetical protein